MKRWLLFSAVFASLAGCATPSPGPVTYPASPPDANGIPVDQTHRPPRASIGIGIGNWGGQGFGGVGIGLGF